MSGMGRERGARRGKPKGHDAASVATLRPAAADVAAGVARILPDLDRPGAAMLTVEDAPQSHVDLADPSRLEFEYAQRLAHLVDLAFPAGAPVSALHLGAGALTLARYLAHTRPGSTQLAVDLDEALIAFVREHLPWDRRWRLRVRAGDAREVLVSRPPNSADVIISDVFAVARTPAHVTTVEYVRAVANALRPAGIYAANVADGAPLTFSRGQAAALRAVFPHVVLVAEPSVLRRRRFGNLVLAGSRVEPPVAELARLAAADPFPARVVAGEDLDRWIGDAPAPTDADATDSPAPPPDAFQV
jgi:spermidine synthase